MRIIIQSELGSPDVLQLQDRPKPIPGSGEILVKLAAAGINPVDAMVRAGDFNLIGEPPFTVGWDLAGTVETLGADVSQFLLGERVLGMPNFPAPGNTYAEYVLVTATDMISTPTDMSDTSAGALPLAGLTALQGIIHHGQVTAGQRVLVHSGAGGVGHLAVQIAKAQGAYVIATASTAKLEHVSALGADEVIDYTTTDFTKVVNDVDMVFDPQAGTQAERSLAVVKSGGRVICLIPPSDNAVKIATESGKHVEQITVARNMADLAALTTMFKAGTLNVLVAERFPLSQAPAAHRALAKGPVGKIVLVP